FAVQVVSNLIGDDLAGDSHWVELSRREKSANRDVFVHIFPVNPYASADKPPVGALLGRGTKKSRKPRQWRRNTPTVHKRDNQFIVGALNIDSVCNRFTGQSAHPKQ